MKNKLKNGFYLSAYCAIDPLAYLLDVTLRHDQNISLWKVYDTKVELIHHWELERTSGFKHHPKTFLNTSHFNQYVNSLLEQYNISISDIVAIVGMEDHPVLHKDDQISYHALCHLYSSLLSNTDDFYNKDIISLSFDGGPDAYVEPDVFKKAYFVGSYSHKGKVTTFPISSPGRIWTIARDLLMLEEGSLMALAYASDSKSFETYEEFPQIIYYNDFKKAEVAIEKLINKVFSYKKEDTGIKFNYFDERFSERDNKISMIMKIIQTASIKMVEDLIDELIDRFKLNPHETCLSLSGGYSLNCPTNTYLMHKYGFHKQIMVPCVNDGGQAIGIGLKFFYDNMDKFDFRLESAYYGERCEGSPMIDPNYMKKYINEIENDMCHFVNDVMESPIVWYDGRAEIGPRALGHRSIIADPRTMKSKDILNEVKERQWWRPVAPIVLKEECEKWFIEGFASPYMLNNFEIKQEKKDQVPAILHMDKTARVQTIDETSGKLYYGLIDFFRKTNIPIICNTSLNDRGEPIINSLMQALNFALRKNLKIVYYNGYRIKLKNHKEYDMENPLERQESFFVEYMNDEDIHKEFNPHQITKAEYKYYTRTQYFRNLNLTIKGDVEKFKKIVDKYIKFDEIRRKKISEVINQ